MVLVLDGSATHMGIPRTLHAPDMGMQSFDKTRAHRPTRSPCEFVRRGSPDRQRKDTRIFAHAAAETQVAIKDALATKNRPMESFTYSANEPGFLEVCGPGPGRGDAAAARGCV